MLSDRIMDIAAWITFPLYMIVVDDDRKWLRLLCFWLSIIIPLWIIGFIVFLLGAFVAGLENI